MRALCVLLLAACAAPDVSGPDAGGSDAGALSEELAASAYCETIAPFFCDFYLRCGRLAAATQEECEEVFAESCTAKYEPRYEALAAEGLLSLSRSGVIACRAHLAAVKCDAQILDLDGPCAAMWVGHTPVGGKCGLDVESFACEPGTKCSLGLDFCGSCDVQVADGEACDGEHACAAGTSCSDGKCVKRAKPGEACVGASDCVIAARCVDGTCAGPKRAVEGGSCAQGEWCPYRTACVGGLCRQQALLGATCGAAGCASGWCEDGTCVALKASGTACTKGAQCVSGTCVSGLCERMPGHCFE